MMILTGQFLSDLALRINGYEIERIISIKQIYGLLKALMKFNNSQFVRRKEVCFDLRIRKNVNLSGVSNVITDISVALEEDALRRGEIISNNRMIATHNEPVSHD